MLVYKSAGFYSSSIPLLALAFFACVAAMVSGRPVEADRILRWFGAAILVGFSVVVFTKAPRSAAPDQSLAPLLRIVALIAVILLAFQLAVIPIAIPRPGIDVWVNNTKAVTFLLKGIDPYSRAREVSLEMWPAATAITFGVATRFGKFAFANYYYFLAALVLLYLTSTSLSADRP